MEQGIQILALTDHNCTRNLPAFSEACELCGIMGLYGIEVNTIEDVHVLVLFEKLHDAMEFGSFIEFLLPPIKNNPKLFGNQNIVNLEGEVTGTVEKLLLSTSGISFNDVIEEGLSRDALVIPAHIDRNANSALSTLGFLPDLPYSAVEAIRLPVDAQTYGKTILTGSDAHYLQHVGRRACYLEMPNLSFASLKLGLASGKISYTH
jgi:PHP family Zn ribbon phosphoesterase